MSQLCVHRDMKHLGSLESTQETLTHLSYTYEFILYTYEFTCQFLTNLRRDRTSIAKPNGRRIEA